MLSGDQVTTIWTTVAAASGALGGAAVSALVTYRVTQRQVNSAEGEAERQRAHELELTTQQRQQERILDAYVTLTRYVSNTSGSIEWKLRDMRVRFDPPLQPPSEDPIDARSVAAATLVASATVGRQLTEYNRALNRYRAALGVFTQVEGWGDIPSTPELVAQRAAVSGAVQRDGLAATRLASSLIDQMRLELGAEGELPSDTSGLEPLEVEGENAR